MATNVLPRTTTQLTNPQSFRRRVIAEFSIRRVHCEDSFSAALFIKSEIRNLVVLLKFFKNTLPWGNLISVSPHLGAVAVVNVTAGRSLCCRSSRQLGGLITLSGALRLTGDLNCRLTRLCFNARWSGGLIAEDSPLCAKGWPLPLYVTELRQTCREMKHYSLISSLSYFTTKALFSSLFFCLSTLERLWKCSCIGVTV